MEWSGGKGKAKIKGFSRKGAKTQRRARISLFEIQNPQPRSLPKASFFAFGSLCAFA
jgi:hypothetical protein